MSDVRITPALLARGLLVFLVLLATVGGCASLLGADFDRPPSANDPNDAGALEGGAGTQTPGPAADDAAGTCAAKCTSPPPNTCIDGKTLKAYAPQGDCDGACTYVPYEVLCAMACQSGACVGDPCAGVICTQPPAASCVDAMTRRSFASTGTCTGGKCSYTSTDVACNNGCQSGACAGDPCAGIMCSQPPAASCVNATTRRTYASAGTCDGGTCSYARTDTACTTAIANADPACVGGACDFACRTGYQRSSTGTCDPIATLTACSAGGELASCEDHCHARGLHCYDACGSTGTAGGILSCSDNPYPTTCTNYFSGYDYQCCCGS